MKTLQSSSGNAGDPRGHASSPVVFMPKKFIPAASENKNGSLLKSLGKSDDSDGKIKPKWSPSPMMNGKEPSYRKIQAPRPTSGELENPGPSLFTNKPGNASTRIGEKVRLMLILTK